MIFPRMIDRVSRQTNSEMDWGNGMKQLKCGVLMFAVPGVGTKANNHS